MFVLNYCYRIWGGNEYVLKVCMNKVCFVICFVNSFRDN